MLEPQDDSGEASRRALRSRLGQLLVVHCAVLFALVGLAISSHASATLISNAVQAEFAASDMMSPAPMQIAQPAVDTLTAREN